MSIIWGCLGKNSNIDTKSFIQNSYEYITDHKNSVLNFWNNDILAFGHNQLYTTLESLKEKQPFNDSFSKLCITADARIDNRKELITLLQTNDNITDVEIILLSYKKWDTQCVKYLIGDFSFAIWDEDNKKLFCARDKLGIKPFFYTNDKTGFYFSSKILPLRKLKHIQVQPNIASMKKFIHSHSGIGIGYTMYEDIFSLPPGNILLFTNNTLSIKRYWFPETISINNNITFKKAVKLFKDIFVEAVQCRLRSAYPIGFELSGGLDSSSVVCIADEIPSKPKTAFINRFGSYECDEGIYSTEVKKKVKMNCIELAADKMDYTDKYSMYFNYSINPDWPIFATFTQKFPMAKLMQEKGIKVVLTGQGADQVLTGNYYMLTDYIKSFQWFKFFSLWQSIHYNKKAILKYSLLRPLRASFLKKNLSTRKINTDDQFNFSTYPLAQYSDLQDVIGESHCLFVDNNAYHPAGSYDIEYRHPFYDSRLVEFALSLPAEYKLWGDEGKRILREAMQDILPEKIRTRQDKAEMSELLRDQINTIDLDDFWQEHYIVDLGIVTHDKVTHAIKIYRSNSSGKGSSQLWRLINLEYWYRVNFKSN